MRKALAILLCGFVVCPLGLSQPNVAPAQTSRTSAAPLTNQDVLDMLAAGLSHEVVLAKIRSSPSTFDTSPAALRELGAANVPDSIILAMVEAGSSLSRSEFGEQPTRALTKAQLPDGTPVELELVENVSSEAVQEGSPIDFSVVQPIEINGRMLIARGAPARGRVMEVKKARHWGRAGKLVWAIQDVLTVDGQRVPLRITKELEGGGSSGKVAAAVIVTAIFFWPAAPVWGLKKGKPAIIPAGTRVTSFVHGDSAIETATEDAEKRTEASQAEASPGRQGPGDETGVSREERAVHPNPTRSNPPVEQAEHILATLNKVRVAFELNSGKEQVMSLLIEAQAALDSFSSSPTATHLPLFTKSARASVATYREALDAGRDAPSFLSGAQRRLEEARNHLSSYYTNGREAPVQK